MSLSVRFLVYFIVTWISLFVSTGLAQFIPNDHDDVKIRIKKDLSEFPAELRLENNKFFKNKNHLRSFEILRKENGLFDLIEKVPFKDYIAGVVSKEMPLAWPMEALKAQAVIARSYALVRITERQGKAFHLDADQMDQVFQWTNSLRAYLAVNETQDVVLASNKKIVKAFYHSDCGGQTLPAGNVWPGANDMGVASDPWCASRVSNRWSQAVSIEDFQQKIKLDKLDATFFKNKITSFEKVSIQKIRQWFGYSEIRNAPDAIEVDEQKITFKGRGFGHGVGLCQWGSLHLAKKGLSYLDILTHYYPKAEILKIQSVLLKNYLTNNEKRRTITGTASL